MQGLKSETQRALTFPKLPFPMALKISKWSKETEKRREKKVPESNVIEK
jgi:hypothetical protein